MSQLPKAPNVVLILTDQQRYDSLGCNGNAFADTPNLDALAHEACCFDRHVTANTVSMPSRASMISGRYPSSHGVWINGVPLPRRCYSPVQHELASHVPTLADVLKEAGYATGSVGKLHLTPTQCAPSYGYEESRGRWQNDPQMVQWHGPYFGFDHVELTIGHGENIKGHYSHWLRQAHPAMAERVAQHGTAAARPFPEFGQLYRGAHTCETHPTTWVGDRASAYIERHGNGQQPFFLWVGIPDPHHPFTPPEELAAMFESRGYQPSQSKRECLASKPKPFAKMIDQRPVHDEAIGLMRRYTDAMVHLIDRTVGAIIDTLKAQGIWDETVLVFTSDHGDWLGDFGLYTKGPHACMALNHTPLIVHAPGTDLRGRVDAPVSNTDILPTICALTGAKMPEATQGESLLAVSKGERRLPVMVQTGGPRPEATNLTVVDQQYRYTWYTATGERELYDHAADPHENDNLLADGRSHPEAPRLHEMLLDGVARTWSPDCGRICNW